MGVTAGGLVMGEGGGADFEKEGDKGGEEGERGGEVIFRRGVRKGGGGGR